MPYPDVIGHVVRANQIFDFVSICVDKTGVGDVIVDEMEQVGLSNIKGLVFMDWWKEEILTCLKLLMERKMLGFLPDDSVLIAQMNEQQFEYTQPKTAREHVYLKFWHPLRRHDDQLFALALACYASKDQEEIFFAVVPTS